MTLCFIIAPQNKDGILDRIATEIGRAFRMPIYHYGDYDLPKADHYFVTHYSMLPKVLEQVNPGITPVTCFFTHDKGGLPNYVEAFNLCHSVIAESPEGMKLLASLGVMQDILHFVPEGGDNILFKPHVREATGDIVICGTNYADGRKNPNLIADVIRRWDELHPNPPLGEQKTFRFAGTGWGTTGVALYSAFPTIFHTCSVYLSCSKLEGGGPNSLIEAMHANLVPVVSDTGNARQYIVDGYNGFIFPLDATPEEVVSLIEKAYLLNPQNALPYADIWQTVQQYTWANYALNMKEIITGDYSLTASQSLEEFDAQNPIL